MFLDSFKYLDPTHGIEKARQDAPKLRKMDLDRDDLAGGLS